MKVDVRQVTDGFPNAAEVVAGAQVRVLGLLRFVRRKPLGALGLGICLLAVFVAIFAPLVATQDHLEQDYRIRLDRPSTAHFFGNDEYGRDMYSRIVFGTRISLMVAFYSIGIGSVVGLLLGIVSGYFGGWVDNLMQRAVEVMLAFPSVFLALALVAMLGSGLDKVIIAVTIVYMPLTLRVMRGSVLSVKEYDYVLAARAVGSGSLRIMLRHILPNVMATYLVVATVFLGAAILIEATLSYLGLGVPPPHPSWGRMLSGGATMYAVEAWWIVVAPGLAITFLVMGFNLFGDALRDIWDPRLRGA